VPSIAFDRALHFPTSRADVNEHRVYRITSIGRPVEPKYPTNKAILILMVSAALIAGLVSAMQGVGGGASARSALVAFLVVFACWALGREMAPDDNPAAFVGAVLAFVSLWCWPSPSLLLLFTALVLARIVNRSTGLTARLGDSVIVTALVIWTMVDLQNPFAGVAGALAFLLDARLAEPNQRQWPFASVCLAAVIIHVLLTGSDNLGATWLPEPQYVIAGVTLLAFLVYALSLRTVSSLGDVGGLVLNVGRVRGGMLVVWLLTLQASLQAPDAVQIVVPLLAVMAGVVLAGTANRLGIPTGKRTGLHL
jgi:chromate transport protein ChrA